MAWNPFRRAIWGRAVRDLRALHGARLPESLAVRLIAGWGGRDRSVTPALVVQCYEVARRATGTLLECGSGVTTVVMALGATGRPASVISLEQDPQRRKQAMKALGQLELRNAEVRDVPLRSYGDFEWYDLNERSLRRPIAAVICHGPTERAPPGEQVREALGDALPADCPVITDAENRTDS